MRKDIQFPKVENVGMAAVKHTDGDTVTWKVHVINLLKKPITNVLIATKGYGRVRKENVQTSQLRHYFEEVPANGERPVEVIPTDLVGLNNEYWLSYYLDGRIYDKKFIFLPDSLIDEHLTELPVIGEEGILIL